MSCGEREIIQSKVTEDQIVCPQCGHVDPLQVWERIEATCNPERTAMLASGELLVHTCSECGAMLPLDYPMFFIDRDRGVAAYYPAGEGDLEALKTVFTQLVLKFRGIELSTLGKNECEVRLVPERFQLVEKVAIWRDGLNDKTMEVFKASLLQELSARFPDRKFVDAQYNGAVNKGTEAAALDILLFDEANTPGVGIQVPFAVYRTLATDIEVRTQVDKNRTPVVDADWGKKVYAAVCAAQGK